MNESYVITPDTDIFLLKCPLEIDSLNQLDFSSATNQHNYFNGLTKILMDDATYMRKDGRLYFEGLYDTYIGYNYCMYKNNNFSSKWFYAYVTDMRYESNNSLSCTLVTDVFQTWMFEKTVHNSFVERSHVSTVQDVAGAYTYPEGLETGEYICDTISSIPLGSRYYVIGVTAQYNSNYAKGGGLYNGIYSGKTYYATKVSSGVDAVISKYDQDGHGDDIAELFIVPKNLIQYGLTNGTVDSTLQITRLAQSVSIEQVANDIIARPSTINGYTPKNKKLLTYPYIYILVDNNAGNSVVYKYELFNNPSNCVLKVLGALTPGTSMSVLPVAYTNSGANANDGGGVLSAPNMYSNALTLGKYPICNWSTDVYINWLTQNSVNLQYNTIASTAKGGIEGFTGGSAIGPLGAILGTVGGSTAGALGSIWENDRSKYEHEFAPNQSRGNANAGDIITSSGANKPSVYKMNIKAEYARIIDDYFSMFGYKINRVQAVNTTSRSKWNYIKTIDVNITGDIPQDDMQKLKSLYNNVFTIWHDTSHFMDYSQTNS